MKRTTYLIGILLGGLALSSAAEAQRPLQQVLDLNRQAMDAYNNFEIEQADQKLRQALQIARRAGLVSAPHGGELCGPDSVWSCLDTLGATRIGHGVRSSEDPRLVAQIAEAGVTLEVCPRSNVALGVYEDVEAVPLRYLYEAGVRIALGADDPLLFGSRLLDQYIDAREVHAFSDEELAELARMSVRGSAAPDDVRATMLADIDAWLAAPASGDQPAHRVAHDSGDDTRPP